MKYLARLLLLGLSALLSFSALADIKDIRVWQYPDKIRVVLDLTQRHEHKLFELDSPARVVLDVSNAKMLKVLDNLELANTPIKSVRSGKRNANDVRIVFDLENPMQSVITKEYAPNELYGHRISLDFVPGGPKEVMSSKTAKAAPKVVKSAASYAQKKRDLIIAIDAGHGGEDPGAIGAGRVMEKHVVLAIAKELQQLFAKEPGYTPIMVRTGDYYLGLAERTKKARAAEADFFVSIHADAFNVATAHGGSVYMLSNGSATSVAARWLADKENRSDLIGGYKLVSESDQVNQILIDLSMTNKNKESRLLGQSILAEMGKVTKLHKNRVEEAGFAVLKAPDIPALLVETGFISNQREAKLLSTPAHQKKLAKAIFSGVTNYFSTHHPDGGAEETKPKNYTYVVKRGDTLSQIALKQGTTMQELKRLNNLKKDSLHVGQKLLVPNT